MKRYQSLFLTVDAIIERNNSVLLIRRKGNTFNGYLALPGGYVDYGETVENAIIREIEEELSLKAIPQEILGVYSKPNRDPRGHVISIVFVVKSEGNPKAGDDADAFEWVDLSSISGKKLAFDHNVILEDFIKWKKEKGTFWSSKDR